MKNFATLFRALAAATALLLPFSSQGQEKVFASYFDIPTGSPKGTEVTGRIHLERNKDVLTSPIPKGYRFEIVSQAGDLLGIETRYDPAGRIMGVLTAEKAVLAKKSDYTLKVALKDGAKVIETFPVTVRIVERTLWTTLHERYAPVTLSTTRMYGRVKPSDAEVAASIAEMESNGGRFEGVECYTKHPQDYKKDIVGDSLNDNHHFVSGAIEFDWEKVCNRIGGLGYAYATSKKYGPEGDPAARERLKRALYSAIVAYVACVPVEGNDVLIDGKPIGDCTGDGFANLRLHGLLSVQVATHQWTISDGMIAPAVNLMPDLLADIKKGDKDAEKVYYSLIRLYQTAFAEVKNRRAIDDPTERWGVLGDTLRGSGAWADANLGHRSRMLLALPIIWADYNRPATYVQYWYRDYYKDKPFPGFSFSPGWSPHGVAADVARWMTKYDVPAHEYKQSGFQPDGTISHHTGNGNDASMVAYGFEWLTACFTGFNQYKDTEYRIADKYYQFPADRLERVYPRLIYKGRFDLLVSGRSYLSDLKKFATREYPEAVHNLKASSSADTRIANMAGLDRIAKEVRAGDWACSGTDAYWVNEFLAHRTPDFYASVKLKSRRTVGAEDFDKVRKSWHMGYGILMLRVTGDEYSEKVISNFDWHVLPGLTEEWRTDPLPAKGGAQASLPGDNLVAGVTSDGSAGLAVYHHLPRETYSSATARKSYHFTGDKIVALGSAISRLRPGKHADIVTCLDQGAFTDALTLGVGGKTEVLAAGSSQLVEREVEGPFWLHTGKKGYVVFPNGRQKLVIRTGDKINVTDRKIGDGKPGFIIALSHGADPQAAGYAYALVPGTTAAGMEGVTNAYLKAIEYKAAGDVHAFYSAQDKTWQAAFFAPGTVSVGGLTITAEDAALVQLRDLGGEWSLTVSNPVPDNAKQQLRVGLSQPLREGTYSYTLGGVYPRPGETVAVSRQGAATAVVAELPDGRDDARYSYQAELYNAAPIIVTIPKK